MFAWKVAAQMRGDPAALEEDLYRRIRQADLHFFMNQLIGNTVVVAIHLDVVIDIDPGRFPLSEDESMNREGLER
jgi:hypothetical protein